MLATLLIPTRMRYPRHGSRAGLEGLELRTLLCQRAAIPFSFSLKPPLTGIKQVQQPFKLVMLG